MRDIELFIGQKLRSFREKTNWPLKTLASHLGVSLQQLQRYEQGVNKISASLLFKTANIFNVPITSFFEGYENVEEKKDTKKDCDILLIEDDPNDEFLLKEALAEFPYSLNIYTIHNGNDAISFFRKLSLGEHVSLPKPNLIFLDLFIPPTNGLAILSDIKHRAFLKDIPVIVLTNSQNIDDIKESYKLQASGFIRKSFSFEEFKAQLCQALNYWIKTVELPKASLDKVAG